MFEDLVQHLCLHSADSLSAPSLVAFQQLVNSRCVRLRTVQLKIQLRWTAQVQTLRYFTANETNGRRQPLKGAFGFLIIALDNHENPGGPGIASQHYTADAGQADPRVAQLAFYDGFDLFAKSLAQPFPMIFGPTLFHCFYLRVKRMRISENQASGFTIGEPFQYFRVNLKVP
jgi:hypothetical protein